MIFKYSFQGAILFRFNILISLCMYIKFGICTAPTAPSRQGCASNFLMSVKNCIIFNSFQAGQSLDSSHIRLAYTKTSITADLYIISTPHTFPFSLIQVRWHTCMVFYLTWQTPNCDQSVSVEHRRRII